MQEGERVKIFWNSSLAWAVDYGEYGFAMALTPYSNFLIVGSSVSSTSYLGKISSSTGTVLASNVSTGSINYMYIYTRDSRALCFPFGRF